MRCFASLRSAPNANPLSEGLDAVVGRATVPEGMGRIAGREMCLLEELTSATWLGRTLPSRSNRSRVTTAAAANLCRSSPTPAAPSRTSPGSNRSDLRSAQGRRDDAHASADPTGDGTGSWRLVTLAAAAVGVGEKAACNPPDRHANHTSIAVWTTRLAIAEHDHRAPASQPANNPELVKSPFANPHSVRTARHRRYRVLLPVSRDAAMPLRPLRDLSAILVISRSRRTTYLPLTGPCRA
jgi:hypothetical protein